MHHKVERLREADVAGIHDYGLGTDTEFGPIGREPIEWADLVGEHKVWNHPHPRGQRRWDLCDHVVTKIVAEHRDRIGALIADAFEPAGHGDDAGVGDGSGFDGGIGEDILNVEHQRATTNNFHQPADESVGQRRRHRQHAVDSTTTNTADHSERAEPAKTKRPAKQIGLVGARKRVHPCDGTPLSLFATNEATSPVRLDGMVAIPGQRGDHMDLVTQRSEFVHDAGHHCSRRRRVGLEMRAHHGEPQRTPLRLLRTHEAAKSYATSSARAEIAEVN
ncbi:unannotated protein [freshwater metagenome]|uniref:Unannotated protein n=1 Tax=freshwater metagenome TaxID=449393 RepID=A0A6J6XIX7_9ZZZZ